MGWVQKYKGILMLLLLMIILMISRYGDMFQWSNYRVIEPWGDGFKAYLVIEYHAKYDSTYSFFQGMNYPYGDHAISAATQPLISNSLKFLSSIFGDLSPHTIPIVNFSLLLSILLTAVFLFLIFKHQRLPDWYAVLAAVGITFLAPQTHRMISHYGLSHPEVIPATIYFLLRFSQQPSVKWSLAIAAVLFIYPLLHFYYFAIAAFLVSFYFLISFIREWDWRKLGHYALHYGIQVGLPLVFYIYWLILNDPIEGRSSKPWGFLEYKGTILGTFTSLTQPHFQWLNEHWRFPYIDFEGQSYLGLMGVLFFFIFIYQWGRRIFRKGDILPTIDNKWFFDRLLLSALIIYIFALGVPFIFPDFEFLLDYMGPIKQFRSIGRYAWVLYYTINILAIIYLYEWVKDKRHWWGRILPFAAILILLFEAYHFSHGRNFRLDEIESLKPGQGYTDTNVDFSDYQAILPVPYYNIGSDNYWWPYSYILSMQQSLVLSIQTGLPVTSAMLTRTSPDQTYKQLQLVTEPYRSPVIFEDYPDDRPLLMLWDDTHLERPEYKDKYLHFQGEGKTIYQEGPIRLASLPLASFEQRIQNRKQVFMEEAGRDSLFENSGFLSSTPPSAIIYESFDDQSSGQPYLGNGGLQFEMSKDVEIFSGKLPDTTSFQEFELLVWMHLRKDLYPRSMITFQEVDEQGGLVQNISTMAWRLIELFDNNGWAMLRIPFSLQNSNHRLRLSIDNKDLRKKVFYLDELLIKPVGLDLYKKTEDYIWKNNRWFPLQVEQN